MALAPPLVPSVKTRIGTADAVPVIPADSALNVAPVKRRPSTETGALL